MNIYSIDIKIGATAYIKAESAEEARAIAARDLNYVGIQFSDRYQSLDEGGFPPPTICMDGRPFACLADNEEAIALSPVMTIHGPWDDADVERADA